LDLVYITFKRKVAKEYEIWVNMRVGLKYML